MPIHGERYLSGCRDPDYLRGLATNLQKFSFDDAGKFVPHIGFAEACALYAGYAPTLNRFEVAFWGCNDRYFLLTELLNRVDAIHPWLYDRCREVEADPYDRLDLWARYHYKSTIITYAGTVQDILRDPEVTVAIFAANNRIAKPFLTQIKEEFESNERLQTIYEDVLWRKPKLDAPWWSMDRGIVVKRKSTRKEPTVNAYGLIDSMPTGMHFARLKYDDLVTQELVSNEEMVAKCTERFEMSDNLGIGEDTRKEYAGTRYCTRGDMRILMADWSHQKIEDVDIGDTVVGWELRDGKRYLTKSKVIDMGVYENAPVRRLTFENGRSVVCTAEHKWWRGPWGSGPEYAPLAMRRMAQGKMSRRRGFRDHVQQLLVPVEPANDRDSGWLAGFYDGEGTYKKNKAHPSGSISLVQTMHNPDVLEEAGDVLRRLGFEFSEQWISPGGVRHDRCVYSINGGWRARYRFLAQIAPTRRKKIVEGLFAQLMTERQQLVADEPAGSADVYWLRTETGNYVVEGFCSSNSFRDTYGVLIERGVVRPRIHAATHDGKLTGRPVFMSKEHWEKVKTTQRSTAAAQMLQNPLAGKDGVFDPASLRPYRLRPHTLNVYIMGDPSMGKKKSASGHTSDRTAIAVVGVDHDQNKYLLDGACHRMTLTQRWTMLRNLYRRWHPDNMRGVQLISVGWERYGMQSDKEYFEREMREPGEPVFPIEELSWTREGDQSKKARVQRLEPDFAGGSFFLPAKVWHPNVTWPQVDREGRAILGPDKQPIMLNGKRTCIWRIDEDTGKIVYTPIRLDPMRAMLPHELREERAARNVGEGFRIIEAIKRRDEDNHLYDLTRLFFEEFIFFPFAPRDDLVDAVSRIYDMEPTAPEIIEEELTRVPEYSD